MKASELIIKLASLIKQHGDQKVTMFAITNTDVNGNNKHVDITDVLGDEFGFELYDF